MKYHGKDVITFIHPEPPKLDSAREGEENQEENKEENSPDNSNPSP